MDDDEAKVVAHAYLDMQRHYGSVLSGKTLDTMRFCMVIGTVYGARMVRINTRKAGEKKDAKPTRGSGEVVVPLRANQAPQQRAPSPATINGATTPDDAAAFFAMTDELPETRE
ncbi:MAG: hypothetical protein P4N59_13155 [Negativicutes bacterium]|nr:hypothetical protein [Negativicutes bacterium]